MHTLNLVLDTSVHQSVSDVWAGFDRQLFNQLSPPFPPVDVVRFDGCLRGDVVHLRLNFLLFKQDWTSDIIDQQTLKTGDRIDEIFLSTKVSNCRFSFISGSIGTGCYGMNRGGQSSATTSRSALRSGRSTTSCIRCCGRSSPTASPFIVNDLARRFRVEGAGV